MKFLSETLAARRAAKRKAAAKAALDATMKPDPAYRERRLRYLAGDPKRRRRFEIATQEVSGG